MMAFCHPLLFLRMPFWLFTLSAFPFTGIDRVTAEVKWADFIAFLRLGPGEFEQEVGTEIDRV